MTENNKSHKVKMNRPLDIFDTATDTFKITVHNIKNNYGHAVSCTKERENGSSTLTLDEFGILKLDNFPKIVIPMDNPYLCDEYGHFGNFDSLEKYAHVYRKIAEDEWNFTDVHNGKLTKGCKEAVLKFMDENIFNTPERKDILEEYMRKNFEIEKYQYNGYDVTLQRESERFDTLVYDRVYDKEYKTQCLTYDINDNKNGRYILKLRVGNHSIGVDLYKDKVKYENNILTGHIEYYRPKLDKLDDIMDIYKKVREGNWQTYNDKGDYAGVIAKIKRKNILLKFMDKYLFNTAESQELLNEYLNKPSFEEYRRHNHKEHEFQQKIEQKVKDDKAQKIRDNAENILNEARNANNNRKIELLTELAGACPNDSKIAKDILNVSMEEYNPGYRHEGAALYEIYTAVLENNTDNDEIRKLAIENAKKYLALTEQNGNLVQGGTRIKAFIEENDKPDTENGLSGIVESKLRKLGKKIESSKIYRTIANNPKTAGAIAGAAIFAAGMTMSGLEASTDKTDRESAPKKVSNDAIYKSGIKGPEYVINNIKINVTRDYLEKNGFIASVSGNEETIKVKDLLQKLQDDNLLSYPGDRKTADNNGIYTPEERCGTVEKLEDFVAKQTQPYFNEKIPDHIILVLQKSDGCFIQRLDDDLSHKSVANEVSNQDKINKLRKNNEDIVDVSIDIINNPNEVHYEKVLVRRDNFQLIGKADERTASASVFMDALRAQRGNDGNKQA